MTGLMSNLSLEKQIERIATEWPKPRSGHHSPQDCVKDFREGLQPDEELLGWINAFGIWPHTVSYLLLLTNKRLVICSGLLRISINSVPLDSITSVECSKGMFGGNLRVQINEV